MIIYYVTLLSDEIPVVHVMTLVNRKLYVYYLHVIFAEFPVNTRRWPNVRECWASVADDGPILTQHWVKVSCLPLKYYGVDFPS